MRRRHSRGRALRKQRPAILVVTNGRKTEKAYLEGLKQKVGREIELTVRFATTRTSMTPSGTMRR